jgi:hypothetical protein
MAVWDAWAKERDRPLVDLLGRAHDALETSITIGIKNAAETVAESEEYVGRGFRVLKVKLGHALAEDLERLARLRERGAIASCCASTPIRATGRASSTSSSPRRGSRIEFTEQPGPAGEIDAQRALPGGAPARARADESLLDERDALRLAAEPRPCGIFNIKLMKCGGIAPGLGIARIAEAANIDLMWGCMDESVLSIAAALHAAFASPNTRYLDLDGSFDLASDFARGGFALENGVMRTLDRPGLGAELVESWRPVQPADTVAGGSSGDRGSRLRRAREQHGRGGDAHREADLERARPVEQPDVVFPLRHLEGEERAVGEAQRHLLAVDLGPPPFQPVSDATSQPPARICASIDRPVPSRRMRNAPRPLPVLLGLAVGTRRILDPRAAPKSVSSAICARTRSALPPKRTVVGMNTRGSARGLRSTAVRLCLATTPQPGTGGESLTA